MSPQRGELTVEADLRTQLYDVRLPNPLILASGILGTSATLLERVARSGAGAVTSKSCGPAPRAGHDNPVVVDLGVGLINAVGLTNPGAATEVGILTEAKTRLTRLKVPLIASIFGGTVEEFGEVARIISEARPDLIEINMSCPNVHSDFGEPFATSCTSAAAVTDAVKRATDCPVIAKLAPNVPNIGRIARAVVEAGADAINAINAMPCMVIDAESGQPVLTNRSGGLSGPALKAIAVNCVYEVARAVDVPIIGTGGVTTGVDAVEMIMAGATAVGVGSAVYYRGTGCFAEIVREVEEFMRGRGYQTVTEMRGLAHRTPALA